MYTSRFANTSFPFLVENDQLLQLILTLWFQTENAFTTVFHVARYSNRSWDLLEEVVENQDNLSQRVLFLYKFPYVFAIV